MIRTIRVKDTKKAQDAGYTVALITKNASISDVDEILDMRELAPSESLLGKEAALKQIGAWTPKNYSKTYAKEYLKELVNNPKHKIVLNELYRRSKDGEKIALACTCEDPDMCHRSTILGLLQAVGCETIGKEYSPYWLMYRALEVENGKRNS